MGLCYWSQLEASTEIEVWRNVTKTEVPNQSYKNALISKCSKCPKYVNINQSSQGENVPNAKFEEYDKISPIQDSTI
jgi:hypothetical protein